MTEAKRVLVVGANGKPLITERVRQIGGDDKAAMAEKVQRYTNMILSLFEREAVTLLTGFNIACSILNSLRNRMGQDEGGTAVWNKLIEEASAKLKLPPFAKPKTDA